MTDDGQHGITMAKNENRRIDFDALDLQQLKIQGPSFLTIFIIYHCHLFVIRHYISSELYIAVTDQRLQLKLCRMIHLINVSS